MKILALDLGKYKSVGCTYDTVTLSEKYDTIALDLRLGSSS